MARRSGPRSAEASEYGAVGDDEPGTGPAATPTYPAGDALAEGDEVALRVGPETYSPIQYNTVTVGPFEGRTAVRRGETPAQAVERLRAFLDDEFQRAFKLVVPEHVRRVREAAAVAKGR